MALTQSSVKRPVVNVGDNLATLQKITGEHVQESAIIGENGEHLGGLTDPIQVNVVNQTAVGGRVESDRDLFGRSRNSDPFTLFESVLEYDLRTQLWGAGITLNTGTVTHLPLESAASLTVSAGQSVTRKTHEHFKHQAGKPNISYLTANIGQAVGTVRRIGYFDEKNGAFFMNDGAVNNFVLRSNVSGVVVDAVVPQSLWNIDKLDGSGFSGFILDINKVQIIAIEMQGLGAGEIRVGFSINGNTTYCHSFTNSNNSTHISVQSSSLPLCYSIDSTTGSGTLEQYDSSVISEGGKSISEDADMIFSANTGLLGRPVSAILTPVISIRPKAIFKTHEYHGSAIVNEIQMLSDSTNIYWEIVLNPVLTGAVWTNVNLESATESDISATATAGGTVLLSGYSERKGSTGLSLPLQKIAASLNSSNTIADIISLNIADVQNNLGNIFASVNFSESY